MRDVTQSSHASDDVEGTHPDEGSSPEDRVTRRSDHVSSPVETGWNETMTVSARGPRRGLWALLLGGVAVLAAAGALTATRLPPGTTLAGQAVAVAADAPTALGEAARTLAVLPVRVHTPVGTEVTLPAAALGIGVDVEASMEPVTEGLQSVAAWAGRLGGPREAPLRTTAVDGGAAADLAERLSTDPVAADVVITRARIEVIDGVDGLDVDAAEVARAVEAAVATLETTAPSSWPEVVDVAVDGEAVPPRVVQADIDAVIDVVAALEAAEVVVTGEVVLPEGDGDADGDADDADDGEDADAQPPRTTQEIVLSGGDIRTLVDVVVDPDAPEGQRLQIVPAPGATPGRLAALMDLARIPPRMRAHIENRSPTPGRGEDPADVSDITGDIVVDEVEPGFEPDADATLALVVEAALAGGGEVEVQGDPGTSITPEDLGIVEPVSTFTTYYEAGQSRVQNIRRMAEIVDGVIVPAGESFEVNHFVGRRTVANGFTSGGAIQEGESVSEIGGGVSQFATTFFNAAWFAGIELVDFKPHSVYFARYPPGREATINYPTVNLEIRNDTPYAILIDTESTATSVTVTFWSTPYWDVQTIMGPCACGGSFRVTNQRILTAPGGQPVTEEYTTTYTVLR